MVHKDISLFALVSSAIADAEAAERYGLFLASVPCDTQAT